MEDCDHFVVGLFLLLLILTFVSAPISENYADNYLVTDGGGESMDSVNFDTSLVGGIISGGSSSDNYINQLGVFYGLNSPPNNPVVSLNTSSGDNITSDNLLCNAFVSDINDNGIKVYIKWYLNDALNLSVEYSGVASGTNFSAILNSGNTTKYQVWSCGMRLYDGIEYSDWVNSSNLTILNAAPVVTLSFPVDGSSTIDRTPLFNWSASDADDDSMTYEINITPYYGNNPSVLDVRYEIGMIASNYTPSLDLQLLYDNGYYYKWKVRADDGEVNGSWSSDWSFNISSEVSISMIVDEIYFGNLAIGESNSTEEGLAPFRLENNGTVLVNVSVNASLLWTSETSDSEYYQFKVGNVSGEEGSFDWAGSITSWFNMPLTAYVVAVNELNYSDDSDSVEVGINMTVPSGESPGMKSSSIVFLAELAE